MSTLPSGLALNMGRSLGASSAARREMARQIISILHIGWRTVTSVGIRGHDTVSGSFLLHGRFGTGFGFGLLAFELDFGGFLNDFLEHFSGDAALGGAVGFPDFGGFCGEDVGEIAAAFYALG